MNKPGARIVIKGRAQPPPAAKPAGTEPVDDLVTVSTNFQDRLHGLR